MHGRGLAGLVEPVKDVLIGSNSVHILFGGKRAHQDGIAAVQGHHNVLVATAGAGGKAAGIISEDTGDRDVYESEFRTGSGCRYVRLRLGGEAGARGPAACGGAYMLAGLGHVAFGSLGGVWAIAGN